MNKPPQSTEPTDVKQHRKEQKKIHKRTVCGEEVIYIFEHILKGWKTIRIYNTIKQTNPESNVTKRKVEQIASGNCKVYPSELTPAKYKHYQSLRNQVYYYNKSRHDEPTPQQQPPQTTDAPVCDAKII